MWSMSCQNRGANYGGKIHVYRELVVAKTEEPFMEGRHMSTPLMEGSRGARVAPSRPVSRGKCNFPSRHEKGNRFMREVAMRGKYKV